MPAINFRGHEIIRTCIDHEVWKQPNQSDWQDWRYCYDGGQDFREEYLERFVGREDDDAFQRRRRLTPIPTYAKREINRVRNSISQRLRDVNRTGGSDQWADLVKGRGRGVDLRGAEMNAFVTKKLLSEVLVMSEVGVLLDAPRTDARSQAEVPQNFRPYLQRFVRESYPILIPADEDSVSDWSHLLVKVQKNKFDLFDRHNECKREWRYYWLEDDEIARFGKVNVAFMGDDGELLEPIVKTNLDAIPFVLFDIGQSLIEDVCSYQITLLNMLSADSNYAIDANYSVLTRQRGAAGELGSHLDGGKGDDVIKSGSSRGIWYNKGLERPGFISPDVEPMTVSLELRRELKKEVRELVLGAIQGMGEDGSIEDGLAFIGSCLQTAERRLWDHWVIFEETRESERKVPTVHYPTEWSLKTDEERLEEAQKFMKLANLMVGRKNKQGVSISAAERFHRGHKSTKEVNAIVAEIKIAPYAISDPDVVLKAKEQGAMSAETASLALGNLPGESLKAKEDAASRAAMVVDAQRDAEKGAARGNPDGSVDPNANQMGREGETEGAANIRPTGAPGRPSNDG